MTEAELEKVLAGRRLQARARAAVRLVLVEGRTSREAGEVLDMSRQAVEAAVRRVTPANRQARCPVCGALKRHQKEKPIQGHLF